MDNQLLRYSAKDYFFRAAICRMCQEVDDAATTLAKYEDMFPAFSDSRECKLLKVALVEATSHPCLSLLRFFSAVCFVVVPE